MKLKLKLASGLVLGAMATMFMAAPVSAETNNCAISGNGAFSFNNCTQKVKNVSVNKKYQYASISNIVVPVSVSGLNFAKFNVGLTALRSGDATNNTNINNTISN